MSVAGRDLVEVEVPAGLPADRAAGYVSDHLVDLLGSLGCRYLPLNPGSSFRGLHDSLVNHGGNTGPQLLLCLHEEIAVSLAHGYAKATGEVAFAAVHDLVGLMHASMAVYDAWCDRVPLLLLGGGGPLTTTARRPIDWLHSAAVQAQLVRDYVKWDNEPADPQALLDGVARGHQLASTAPTGPVYVTLDADLQEQPTPPDGLVSPDSHVAPDGHVLPDSRVSPDGLVLPDARRYLPQPGPGADPEQVLGAARVLVAAEAPLIVAGRVGLRPEATAPLVELAELLAAAYQDAPNTVCFPTTHPHNLSGDPTVLDTTDAVLAVDLADLRAVRPVDSSREPGTTDTESADRVLVAITLDPLVPSGWAHAGQAPVSVDLALLAEPLTGLRQLRDAVAGLVAGEPPSRRRVRERRRETLAVRHRELRAGQRAAVEATRGRAPIAPAYLAAAVWDAVKDRPWLLTLRNTRSWPEGIWQFPGAGSFLGHSGGGGVGYGPGAMVGGALAARDRGQLPVAIIGDGDLLMAPGALWTAVHYRIPLLVVVNNNRSFHNDEEHQHSVARQRGRPVDNSWIGMRIDDPPVDLAGLARSFGAWATGPVTDPAALPVVLDDALHAVDEGRVALVDVHTAPRPRRR